MSDTAAFFANKKKKKKAPFKFNANLIDVSSVVTTAVHVDAPALSTDGGLSHGVAGMGLVGTDSNNHHDRSEPNDDDEQWDDEALASSSAAARKHPPTTTAASGGVGEVAASTATLLDYKSLAPKHGAGDSIAEKLRLEETKAQLAAAREGMEREAQKIKEEKERKDQAAASKAASGATAGGGLGGGIGGGSRWLPPHLRAGGAASGPAPNRFGGVVGGKLDVQSEELFPDLASAEKILQQKEKEQHQTAFRIPKKTPVGGGATWASKPAATAPATAPAPAIPPAPPGAPSAEPAQPETPAGESAPDESEPPAAASAQPTEVAAPKALPKVATKKKVKKDLSTFKPGA